MDGRWNPGSPKKRLPAVHAASLGLLVVTLAACDYFDRLLSVEAPTQVIEETLDDPRKAGLLVTSAVSLFDCALGAYIVATGEISDILMNSGNEVTRARYDARDLQEGLGYHGVYGTGPCAAAGTGLGVYRPVQESRWLAEDVRRKLEGWSDAEVDGDRTDLIAITAAYAGYSYVLLGEGFCSAAIDGGPELTSAEIMRAGEQRFGEAIQAAHAAENDAILNMAYVGRARLRLNLGDLTGALEDARQVTSGFAITTEPGAADLFQYNMVYYQTQVVQNASVREPYRDLTWAGAPDPRMAVVSSGPPRNVSVFTKYGSLSQPIRIASWEEAQLIIAEIEGGQTAVDIINELHAKHGLPPFQSTDPQEIQDHVIQERTRELLLEGQRLYDMIRLGLPFLPETGQPFAGSGGGVYGSTTCMPIPPIEVQNNPNI